MSPSPDRAFLRRLFLQPSLRSIAALLVAFAPTVADAQPDAQRPGASTGPGTAPNPSRATEPGTSPERAEAPGEKTLDTSVQPSPEKRPENGYWSVGEPRWFVSTKSDVGTPYLKPYLSAGYGLPHFIWAGVDVNSITTLEFTQVYAGVRAATPVLDFAFGFRDTWSFNKPFLTPKQSYSRSDVLDTPGPRTRYWAWEAEVVGIVPLPYSAIVADLIFVKTLDAPQGMYVYEESYRAIVAKPLYGVFRAAVVARILREGALKFGPLFEYVFSTGRERDVYRVGPAASFQLTDHLEVQGALTLAVSSPDPLGLVLGAYGVAGLRYRWATGERAPKLPWQGELIP